MAIRLTSGQLASWKAGRGLRSGWLVGGTAVGGIAVVAGPGRRTMMTMTATTKATTTATAAAAISARIRWRLRRSVFRDFRTMLDETAVSAEPLAGDANVAVDGRVGTDDRG